MFGGSFGWQFIAVQQTQDHKRLTLFLKPKAVLESTNNFYKAKSDGFKLHKTFQYNEYKFILQSQGQEEQDSDITLFLYYKQSFI